VAYIDVTPGSAFGVAGKNYVRFSFATSIEDILEGMERIEKMFS
jgi:aspartate/methionine/tyrosine aminotransferase